MCLEMAVVVSGRGSLRPLKPGVGHSCNTAAVAAQLLSCLVGSAGGVGDFG